MSEYIEFTAKTTEEALGLAGEHFGVPLSRLEFEVISAGSPGLFGLLGAKKAKIKARLQAGGSMAEQMAELAAVVSDGRAPAPRPRPAGGDAGRPAETTAADLVASVLAPAPKPAPTPEVKPEPRPEAKPAPAPAAKAEPPAPVVVAAPAAPAPPEAVAVEDFAEEPDNGLGETEPVEPGEAGDEDDEDEGGDARLEQDPAVIDQARQVLARLVAPLDLSAQVTAASTDQGIELCVQGQEVGVLIGRRGTTLEALQYLTVRIVSHQHGRPVRIVVDAGDYRRRRREALEDTARRMAVKAKSSGRPVAIGPLSAQERRVVHLALKSEPGLVTISRGRGELKKVVITPRT